MKLELENEISLMAANPVIHPLTCEIGPETPFRYIKTSAPVSSESMPMEESNVPAA